MAVRYVITITSEDPDGDRSAIDAAQLVAEGGALSGEHSASVEVMKVSDSGTQTYLAGWEVGPGEENDPGGVGASAREMVGRLGVQHDDADRTSR